MAINYIDPATSEPVTKERHRWVVYYTDGTELHQFEVKDGVATFHKFADIDTGRVHKFMLVNDVAKPVVFYPPQGAQIVHFYTKKVLNRYTSDGTLTYTDTYQGYVIGYKLHGNDYGVLVDYDDSVQIINDFTNVDVARELQ